MMVMRTEIEGIVSKHEEGIRYVIFGGFTVLVSWASYALFTLGGMDPNLSNAFSWLCAVIFAFFVNKYFVFKCLDSQKVTLGKELTEFFMARVFTGIVAILLFPLLIDAGLGFEFMGVEGLFARGVNSAVEIVLNYLFSKFIVFRKP